MKLKTAILYSFTLACLAMPIFAETAKKKMTNSEKARMISEKTGKLRGTLKGYTAKEISADGKYVEFVFRKFNLDGSSSFRTERYKTNKSNKLVRTTISGRHGSWILIGNIAIKNEDNQSLKHKKTVKPLELETVKKIKSKYSLKKDKIVNNINCFVVETKVISNTKDFADFAPVLGISYIGKKDYFCYSAYWYNKKGEMIFRRNYFDVKLDVNLPEALFEIPSFMEIKIPKNYIEHAEYYYDATKKNRRKKK